MIQQTKENLAKEQITTFLKKMEQLGFSKEETISLMEQTEKGEK